MFWPAILHFPVDVRGETVLARHCALGSAGFVSEKGRALALALVRARGPEEESPRRLVMLTPVMLTPGEYRKAAPSRQSS